jgi:transcriptional regulator with XRE-family HTH domain
MNLGFKIKKLREQKKISQEDLAFRLDISQSKLCRIENGETEKTDFIFMQKVCDFFNVEPNYFFDDPITQNNTENQNSAITVFGNPTVNVQPTEYLEHIIRNQEQITKLIETQNKLVEGLLKK